MSTHTDIVRNALGEKPLDRAAIAEATGLEIGAVSTALTFLKNRGEAVRAEEGGWLAGDGHGGAAHVHHAPAPSADADEGGDPATLRRGRPPGSRSKRKKPRNATTRKKHPPAKRVQRPAAKRPAGENSSAREYDFAISESGNLLYRFVSGTREGQTGVMHALDLRALKKLLSGVELV